MQHIGRKVASIGFVAAVLAQAALLQPVLAEPPKLQVDPTWPQTLPSNWIIGTIRCAHRQRPMCGDAPE